MWVVVMTEKKQNILTLGLIGDPGNSLERNPKTPKPLLNDKYNLIKIFLCKIISNQRHASKT